MGLSLNTLKFAKYLDQFKKAYVSMEEEYLHIRKTRKELFKWDMPGCGEDTSGIDLKLTLCDHCRLGGSRACVWPPRVFEGSRWMRIMRYHH